MRGIAINHDMVLPSFIAALWSVPTSKVVIVLYADSRTSLSSRLKGTKTSISMLSCCSSSPVRTVLWSPQGDNPGYRPADSLLLFGAGMQRVTTRLNMRVPILWRDRWSALATYCLYASTVLLCQRWRP